jgi:outer membrane immunogenic protein
LEENAEKLNFWLAPVPADAHAAALIWGTAMKKLLLAPFACVALVSGSALAADMPLKAPLPLPPAPTWTGCYVDGGVGYGLWNRDHSLTFPPIAGVTTTVSNTDGGHGWLGRLGGGCDYQLSGSLSRWVIGAFGDYDFMELQSQDSFTLAGLTANAKETETGAWYAGARIGYLITPSILSYVDGGYTQTRFNRTGQLTLTGLAISEASNHTFQGWFLGGGTETAVSDWLPGLPTGLFLRSEYRFGEYQTRNSEFAATGLPGVFVEHATPYVQTITTSLVWRFNWTNH